MDKLTRADALGISNDSPFQDSAIRWFVRGLAIGMLIVAAINAISYFLRSSDWGGLVGPPRGYVESLGFPLVIWEGGNTYGGMFVDYANLGWNVMFAVGVGSVIGFFVARRANFLNRLIQQLQSASVDRQHQPIQFSLLGMMIATAVIAIAATIARKYAARPETLVAIYALGPLVLVAMAMLPQRLAWQKRVMIIIPATFTLIAVAIAVGIALGMEFDKVMMGIFLCWTPQSVLAAVGLTVWVLVVQIGETTR